jgi:hypothetical protein
MNRTERADWLAARRELLLIRAQTQRDELALQCRGFEAPLRWVDRGWQLARLAHEHPWALAAPAIAVALFRPRWLWQVMALSLAVARFKRRLR